MREVRLLREITDDYMEDERERESVDDYEIENVRDKSLGNLNL